ncbi:sigma E protease regulator RseP [Shewanella yunxiaonensis]|uniref:Zinc metalloprotease n=1 Tax=Shewanella yunxiaonensis TaxID=2829809 RepID=A0ABX7YQ94_9GAMM|nr:sigma E protease regulator RseP [Shewanella yunxiaonensis]QUN04877.1 sigma E protease regulator RseP [Shewanella yunxiaonensis]
MLAFLWNLGAFIVALGILITAHEFGHFYIARRCGVRVLRFSIGFGKAIWRHVDKDGTEYVVAMIPLGGYVKMLDERVEDVPPELQGESFNRKSVWARMAIVAAGPIANFIFAIIALYLMYLIGVPAVKPVIDSTTANSPAAVISLQQPQQIVAVSGQQVRTWEDVNLALVSHIGEQQLSLTLSPVSDLQEPSDTNGKTYALDIRQWHFDPDKESPISALGLHIYRPEIIPTLAEVVSGGAADKAGLKVGDTLVAIDGGLISSWDAFVQQVKASAGKTLNLTIKRNGEQQILPVTPDSHLDTDGHTVGYVGISPVVPQWPENMQIELHYGPLESLSMAAQKTWQLTAISAKMLGKLFTGDVSLKSLSGPISIAQGAGNTASFGLVYFLGFLALISVNLGIINLMPLPVLDGGHLMYCVIEAITRKPVSDRIQEIGFRFGAALLLVLMSIALFNDFARL